MKKKNNLFLLILGLITLLMLPKTIYAQIIYQDQLKCTTDDSAVVYQCQMGFEVTEKAQQKNHIKVTLVLTNMTLSNFKVSDGFYKISEDSSKTSDSDMTYNYEFGSIVTNQAVGYHEMATITLTKVMEASDCHREYHGVSTENIDRVCKVFDINNKNYYYNNAGENTTWQEYKKECDAATCTKVCEPGNDNNCLYFDNKNEEVASEHEMKVACKKYSCEEVNGQYFNKTGEEVSWSEYQRSCKKLTCDSICNPKSSTDCLYFNESGESVSEHEMKATCKKYSCEYQSGNYYDKSGNEVTWQEYDKACITHACVRVCDPNNNNSCLYYNKSNNAVTWQEYEKDCNQYSCQKVCEPGNNKNCLYYDKSGNNVTSEEEMNKTCTQIEEVHKCEVYNNQYYDNNSQIVTWKEYKLACEPGICQKVCDPKNAKECLYFDKLGLANTETKYLQECLSHVCEQVGDLFYDKDGNIVSSEEEMNKSCVERNSCELKNGQYFDKDGNVTDKVGYEISCLEHKCKKVGNTYFDKDGNVVTADAYDKSCNATIENPQTGWSLPIIGLLLLGISSLLVYNKMKKYNKFM